MAEMITLDGNGIGAVIGAAVAGIVSLGTFGMQVVAWRDARELKRLSKARDVQLGEVKDLVNGKSERLLAATAKDAYEAGRLHERVAPDQPSPEAVSVVVTPQMNPSDPPKL